MLPPDKPKLNRKKFIEEARKEWHERSGDCFIWEYYLINAISYMLGRVERRSLSVSLEAVGVAKALKIAVRLHEFHEKLKVEGRDQYPVMEEYEYIKDILDA